jgi:hypothetical protein
MEIPTTKEVGRALRDGPADAEEEEVETGKEGSPGFLGAEVVLLTYPWTWEEQPEAEAEPQGWKVSCGGNNYDYYIFSGQWGVG